MILKIFGLDLMKGILPPDPVDDTCTCKCKLNDDYKAGYHDGTKDNT